ncbi:MAG: hypothetical protein AAFV53_35385, partial [Myxococcota bacterium]
PLDAYYTPDRLAQAIVAELPIRPGDRILEPHAGGGAFVRALVEQHPDAFILATDLDSEAPGLQLDGVLWSSQRDFLQCQPRGGLSWIVGNPPYSQAGQHIRHALSLAPNVVFLLRLAFVESKRRIPFWAEHPARHIWMLAERPSFTGGGTDSAAYAAIWWDRDHSGPTTCQPGWSWRTPLIPGEQS